MRRWILHGNTKRAGIFPLIPCMKCSCYQKEQYEMCSHYSYLGSRTAGGFAEYVKVPEWNLLELPDNVTFEQAAMLEPMSVAVHAIGRIQAHRDEKVAVCGLGTIGLFVVMFLQEVGIHDLIVIGNKDCQKEMILKLGLDEERFCDIRVKSADEWLEEQSLKKEIDVFFDCVGSKEVLGQALNYAKPGGRIQLVGNPDGDMEMDKATWWKVLRKQLVLSGTWNSSYTHKEEDDWHYVLEKLSQGKIHPEMLITHRFCLDELMQGFELMRDRKEDYVKVMGEFE